MISNVRDPEVAAAAELRRHLSSAWRRDAAPAPCGCARLDEKRAAVALRTALSTAWQRGR